MVRMWPIDIGGRTALGIEVQLPRTHLAIVTTDAGYIMCGALDVALLSGRLRQREIVAARAVGVQTVEQLLAAPMESVTPAAAARGVQVGMSGSEAIGRMF